MSRPSVVDALPRMQALGDPRPDLNAAGRVLVKLAETWDDAHALLTWSAVPGWPFTHDEATAALYVTARAHAHPSVGDQLPFLMAALCEAVDERVAFEDDPRSVIDVPLREETQRAIAQKLDQHLVDCLLPLVTGQRAHTAVTS
jgi:hypothetical protein